MPKLSIHTMVAALSGSILLAACPGDDSPVVETETENESTSTGTVPTTMPPTTTPPPDGTTTMGDDTTTTASVDDTATTMEPGTTTTGDESTGTTGGTTEGTTEGTTTSETTTTGDPSTTEGGSESSTGEPPPPGDGYGDCANNDEALVCLPDEVCLFAGADAACMEQGCAVAGDCAVPTTGTAVSECMDLTGDGVTECFLDCAGGEICPDGMICGLGIACVWPFQVPGGGLCPDQDIGNALPQTVMGDNTGLFDDWVPSCSGNGDDAMFQFTAPAAGTYVFDTAGTGFDTVLAVLDGCAGPELACNDDAGGTTNSEVSVVLAAGQSVIVVVDGYAGATGPFNLNVSALVPGMCPDQDLGNTVPQTVMGTNANLGDEWTTSCGAGGGEDAMFEFTAPAADTYVFDTQGSMFDTILAVLQDCGGPELACNDDTVGTTSQVILDLAAGESVTIVVDGFAGSTGPFTLNIGTM